MKISVNKPQPVYTIELSRDELRFITQAVGDTNDEFDKAFPKVDGNALFTQLSNMVHKGK